MADINRERWALVAPYLDQALDMSEAERPEWIAAIARQDASLAADLQSLLHEHDSAAREQFLERSPATLLASPTLAGATFGAYTLTTAIGRGGMGTVWLAIRSDGRFDGRAAVKLLNIALIGRAGEERFKREDRGATPHSRRTTVAVHTFTTPPAGVCRLSRSVCDPS